MSSYNNEKRMGLGIMLSGLVLEVAVAATSFPQADLPPPSTKVLSLIQGGFALVGLGLALIGGWIMLRGD